MNPFPAPAGRNSSSVSRCGIEHLGMLRHPPVSDDRQKAGGTPKGALGGTVPVEGTCYRAAPTCSPGSGRGEDIPALIPSGLELSASLWEWP